MVEVREEGERFGGRGRLEVGAVPGVGEQAGGSHWIGVEGEVFGDECEERELRRDLNRTCLVGEGVGEPRGDCERTEGIAEEEE